MSDVMQNESIPFLIVAELRRLNNNIEQYLQLSKPKEVPFNFDADEHSAVLYPDEFGELVSQHLGKNVAGINVGRV
jgi:hypothetical protein